MCVSDWRAGKSDLSLTFVLVASTFSKVKKRAYNGVVAQNFSSEKKTTHYSQTLMRRNQSCSAIRLRRQTHHLKVSFKKTLAALQSSLESLGSPLVQRKLQEVACRRAFRCIRAGAGAGGAVRSELHATGQRREETLVAGAETAGAVLLPTPTGGAVPAQTQNRRLYVAAADVRKHGQREGEEGASGSADIEDDVDVMVAGAKDDAELHAAVGGVR